MQSNRPLFVVIWISLLLLSSSIKGQPCNQIYIFEDSTARMDISAAMQLFYAGNFNTAPAKAFNMGFTQSIFWLAVPVDSLQSTRSLFLTIGNSHINIIRQYLLQKNTARLVYTTGDYYPFKQRPIPSRDFSFTLNNPGIYFFKVDKHNESLQLYLDISTEYEVLKKNAEEESIMAFFMGMMCLMIIFGLYLFAISRQKIYLLYILFILTGWGWVLANLGFGMQYLWPNAPWFASKARLIFALLAVLSSMHFMEAFVGGIQIKWVRHFIYALSALIILIIIIIFLGSYSMNDTKGWLYFQFFIPAITLLYLCFAIGLLIYLSFKGNRNALFFLCSTFLLVLAGIALSFYNTGTIKNRENILVEFGLPMGYLLQLILLTGGLVYRFNEYRKEKDNLLLEMNKRQLANARMMMEVQQAERSQVADQLHDVAGSMLSAARLNLSSIIEQEKGNADIRILKTDEAVSAVSDTIRNLSHALSPVMLEQVGFKTSLEKIISIFNASGKIDIRLIVLGFENYDTRFSECYHVLYSIIYECLNNIAKHAKASYALVQVSEHPDCFTVVVEDNGIGTDLVLENIKTSHGLNGIKSKVNYFNGQLALDKNEPTGLIITIEIPRKIYDS